MKKNAVYQVSFQLKKKIVTKYLLQ